METLYEGAALAVLVVFLFLRNWRATVITALALPLSIIPTFFAMDLLGFSLNIVSLLGITLVTGILVDDAIVEIENIERHMQMGRSAYDASEEAASEIGLTVVAISLTIIAVFAPVSFMGGIAGQYFAQFGLTVAFAVFFSLIVARLLTPMFAAYFLRDGPAQHDRPDGWLMGLYMGILSWTVRHRGATLLLGLLIFAGSIYSATLLPTEFIPREDQGRSVVSVELPPGSTLDDNRDTTARLARELAADPNVKSVFVLGRHQLDHRGDGDRRLRPPRGARHRLVGHRAPAGADPGRRARHARQLPVGRSAPGHARDPGRHAGTRVRRGARPGGRDEHARPGPQHHRRLGADPSGDQGHPATRRSPQSLASPPA